MNAYIAWWCAALWTACLPANTVAQTSGISLDEAIALTLERHPAFAAADHRGQAMAARIRGAALQPPLRISIEFEDLKRYHV